MWYIGYYNDWFADHRNAIKYERDVIFFLSCLIICHSITFYQMNIIYIVSLHLLIIPRKCFSLENKNISRCHSLLFSPSMDRESNDFRGQFRQIIQPKIPGLNDRPSGTAEVGRHVRVPLEVNARACTRNMPEKREIHSREREREREASTR